MKEIRMYEPISHIYDIINSEVDYDLWASYYYDFIRFYIDKDNISLLECGCGTGRFTNSIKRYIRNVEGVDIAPSMIDIARKNYRDIHFFVGDFTDESIFTKNYDVIISVYDTVNHIEYLKIPSMIDMWRRHLNEGGIIIFDYNTPEGLKYLNGMTAEIDGGRIKTSIKTYRDGRHAVMDIYSPDGTFKVEEFSDNIEYLKDKIGRCDIYDFLTKNRYNKDDLKVVFVVRK